MTKKLLFSAGTLVVALALMVGGTTAFFSDVELSSGNTFTAGTIDLKIDNESYVTATSTNQLWDEGDFIFSPWTSWAAKDLNDGELFFDFEDLKPGDVGEDTISLHVQTNAAYACMDVTLTGTPENGENEPEALVDNSVDEEMGELQDKLYFVWWMDDGDNVFETNETENVFAEGLAADLFTEDGKWTLADGSEEGVFDGALDPNTTYYIAKAWCFGDMKKNPVLADREGATGTEGMGDSTNGPLQRGTGFTCSGAGVSNASQTDGITVDVVFDAVQSRGNDAFLCNPPTTGTITVLKVVENGDGGEADVTDFEPYTVDGNSVALGAVNDYAPGSHTVGENTDPDYVATFSGDCDANGVVNVVAGNDYTCTITNTYAPQTGNITVNKVVVGGQADDGDFALFVGAEPVVDEVTEAMAPGTYQVSETGGPQNYDVSFSGGCTSTGLVTVVAGQDATCTITNTYNPQEGTLTLQKTVVGGQAVDTSFTLSADGPTDISGVEGNASVTNAVVAPGVYNLSESNIANYSASAWVCVGGTQNDSDTVTIADGDNVTCTITNTFVPPQPVALLNDGFGTGSTDGTFGENPDTVGTGGWTEGSDGAEKRATGSGNDTASPDGGRFAVIFGETGYICRTVNATGYNTVNLSYYWRGDEDAFSSSDNAIVEFKTSGSCSDSSGWTQLQDHNMQTDAAWSTQAAFGNAGMNNTSFLLRFRTSTNDNDEHFRVDKVIVTGIPN